MKSTRISLLIIVVLSAVLLPGCPGNSGHRLSQLELAALVLGDGTVGQIYSNTSLQASGGTTPYSFAISAGALPAGLDLSTSGVVSGTPTAAGTSNFTVQVTDSSKPTQTTTQSFSILVNPAPGASITTLSPSSAVAGSGDLVETIAGTGFASGAVVNFGSSILTPSAVTATQVTVTIPSSSLATGGTAAVTVTNPGALASNVLTFIITNPVPFITSITPTIVIAGQNTFTQTINGSGFLPGMLVTFTGSFGSTTGQAGNVTPTQATFVVPNTSVLTAGAVQEVVIDPDGSTSNSKMFRIFDSKPTYSAGPIFPAGDVPSVVANNVMVVADGPSANVFQFDPTNSIWSEASQLGDWVSVAVGPNGTPAVTGAPATSPSGSGTARVFRAGSQGWPTGTLSGSDLTLPTAAGPLFGKAVAINEGNAVFVGDPGNASVFVFRPRLVQFDFASQITDSASGTSSGFGSSISTSLVDSVLAVGEPQGPTAPGQVAIYFGLTTSTNMPNAVLQAAAAANGDMEGFSVQVSADGNTVIFGGPGANSGTGAAWVFTRSNSDTWSQTATLLATTGHAGDGFGTSVAASSDGSTIVVGAPGVNSGAGAVYVFQAPFSGTQNENQLVTPYAGTAIDGTSAAFTSNFGSHVNISNDASTISVGGLGTDSSGTGQRMAGVLQ